MASIHQRAFAGFFAVLFLITSSALAIAVILTLIQQHNKAKTSGSSTTASASSPTTVPKPQGKLAGFTPIANITQLKTIDLKAGSGAVVKPGDTVTAEYTGAVAATGNIFQSSTAQFNLNQVIPGWSQGIPGMKVGGTRQLLIPSNLAYGVNPPPGSGIPANAGLVFNVTITKID